MKRLNAERLNGGIGQAHRPTTLRRNSIGVADCCRPGRRHARSALSAGPALCSLSGTSSQWQVFSDSWGRVLKIHGADFLHTTDVVARKGAFKKWAIDRRDNFIADCAEVIAGSIVRPAGSGIVPGLGIGTVTVVLKDFVRRQPEVSDGPKDATEVCAVQSVAQCFDFGALMGAHWYRFYFDRNEPFRGHVVDRWKNKKVKREIAMLARVTACEEVDMRRVPALQAADLISWCVNRKNDVRYKWQKRVLDIPRQEEWLDHSEVCSPQEETIALVTRAKLPRRRPTQ